MHPFRSLSERLRWAREQAGHSARGLDALAGITPGHTTLIESGRRADPSGTTMAALARALGLSCEWLIAGQGSPPVPKPADSSTNLADDVEHRAAS